MKKLLLLIACAIVFVGCGCSTRNTPPDSVHYTKEDYAFSESKDWLEQSIEIVSSGDKDAFSQMLNDGKIYLFKNNIEVYVVESGFSKIKVRLKGGTTEVWTVRDAVNESRN